MEFTLVAAAATAVAALWVALRLTGRSEAFDVALTAMLVGLATGRITAMAAAGVNPALNPLDVLLVRGGVDTLGASAGALAYLLWKARRSPGVLSSVAPAAVAGLAGWHGGCLWRDSCLGTAADVPWGWALAGSEVTRHPVELYTAALLVLLAWAVAKAPSVTRPGLALAAMAVARSITEPLRPALGADAIWWYVAATLAGLVWAAVGLARRVPERAD